MRLVKMLNEKSIETYFNPDQVVAIHTATEVSDEVYTKIVLTNFKIFTEMPINEVIELCTWSTK